MCIVSNIGDSWRDNFPDRYPWWPNVPFPYPNTQPAVPMPGIDKTIVTPGPSQEEFDKLKAEVEELKKLLKAAKEFDEKTGQKDCHMDEKVEFIKKVAEFVGVDLKEVFGK